MLFLQKNSMCFRTPYDKPYRQIFCGGAGAEHIGSLSGKDPIPGLARPILSRPF